MIVIVDFGSQTAHLIGRRLRDLGVETSYVVPEDAEAFLKDKKPSGIILSGGPSSVYEEGAPTVSATFFETKLPILGICYGWQLMAQLLGGEVTPTQKEYGKEPLTLQNDALGLAAGEYQVIMSHGDSVVKAPAGFRTIGSTEHVPLAAVADTKRGWFGVQFHPEADHTEHGNDMLRFFAQDICHESIKPIEIDSATMIEKVKKTVGTHEVIGAVSGGVDSSVAGFLIAKAIGKQFIPVYVESGLMRPEARGTVEMLFTKIVKTKLVIVEAQDRFMAALKGITDPEVKRKTIGKLYIDIFQEEAKKHRNASFLAQGTIYSDVIESKGSKHASQIKSHHNVGGLPKDMKLELLEPVRTLYKDEVRKLGRMLGLPAEMVNREPFPGPGYAIRVRGEVTPDRLAQVKIADQIVLEEVKSAGLYDQVFQCFALMSGAFSTAVKGDGRVFAEVVAVRAYESTDVMTSQWAHLPYQVLQRISQRIVNEVPNVSRVVYDITSKPPATMEWE